MQPRAQTVYLAMQTQTVTLALRAHSVVLGGIRLGLERPAKNASRCGSTQIQIRALHVLSVTLARSQCLAQ